MGVALNRYLLGRNAMQANEAYVNIIFHSCFFVA